MIRASAAPKTGRATGALGEHTREVLAEAGPSPAEIDALVAVGAAVEDGRAVAAK